MAADMGRAAQPERPAGRSCVTPPGAAGARPAAPRLLPPHQPARQEPARADVPQPLAAAALAAAAAAASLLRL